MISAICCCTCGVESLAVRGAVRAVRRFDREGADALQVVDDGGQRAAGGLGFGDGVVRVVDRLIGAVDLGGELLADRETRGVVGRAVDAQARGQPCQRLGQQAPANRSDCSAR